MEPQTGRDIKIQIDMMHAMDSPEHRNRVKHYVLEINCEIEDDNSGHYRGPGRNVQIVQQSPTASLALQSKGYGCCGEEESLTCRIQHAYAEIAWPAF